MVETLVENDVSIKMHRSAKPLLTSVGLVSTEQGCVCGRGVLSTMSVWPWWASKVPTPGARTQQGLWRVALTGGHHCDPSVAGSAEPPTVPAPPHTFSLCFSRKAFLPWGLTHKPGPHRPKPASKRVLCDQP